MKSYSKIPALTCSFAARLDRTVGGSEKTGGRSQGMRVELAGQKPTRRVHWMQVDGNLPEKQNRSVILVSFPRSSFLKRARPLVEPRLPVLSLVNRTLWCFVINDMNITHD